MLTERKHRKPGQPKGRLSPVSSHCLDTWSEYPAGKTRVRDNGGLMMWGPHLDQSYLVTHTSCIFKPKPSVRTLKADWDKRTPLDLWVPPLEAATIKQVLFSCLSLSVSLTSLLRAGCLANHVRSARAQALAPKTLVALQVNVLYKQQPTFSFFCCASAHQLLPGLP